MVGGVPPGQLFATCRPAAALVPAANAAAAGAAHDPAAHGAGPGAAEECTVCCKWIQEVDVSLCNQAWRQESRGSVMDMEGMTC